VYPLPLGVSHQRIVCIAMFPGLLLPPLPPSQVSCRSLNLC